MFDRVTTFLKEARLELKKVTWPTRADATYYTLTVIVISGAMAIFLGGLDLIFQWFLDSFVL